MQLQVTSAGAFPSPQAPRVVWLGLGGDVLPLTRLYYRLEKAFAALGYLPEGRAFNPHLTLGRVKSPANRERLARLLAKLPPLDWPPFTVKELILFQSVLSPQGSKYTPLKVIPLGNIIGKHGSRKLKHALSRQAGVPVHALQGNAII